MNVESVLRVIEAFTKLIGVLVWPSIALFVLVRFGSALRDLIGNIGEFSLKAAGFEASGKRIKAEAAGALAAAAAKSAQEGDAPEIAAKGARDAVNVVAEVVTPRLIRRAAQSVVLWVDDRPNNNIHERQALEALGVSFVLATSTDEALEKAQQHNFDAIISDMGRPPDTKAGHTLLEKLRALGNKTPFIIYAGSRSPEHQALSRMMGAIGCTNRPNELFEMVLRVVAK